MKVPRIDHVESRWVGDVSDPCCYCGMPSQEWEHVIPISYRVPTVVVRSCQECNSLAGDKVFDSIIKKYEHIQKELRRRYRKLHIREKWEPEELKELSYKLQVMVQKAEAVSVAIGLRLSWFLPNSVTDEHDAFMLEQARRKLREKNLSSD